MNEEFEDYEKQINSWKSEHKIEDFKMAEKNKYLLNNILFLKPGEEYSYTFKLQNSFDISQYPFSSNSFYLIGPGQKYLISLRINIPKNISNYITNKQLRNMEYFQLFSGLIKSNEVVICFEDFACESQQ